MNNKTYSEMTKLRSLSERIEYLKINYDYTSPRTVSTTFYKSKRWLDVRKRVIARDLGFDLGVPGLNIEGRVLVHHIVPITEEDIEEDAQLLYDMDNLVTVSETTHNQIHYGTGPVLLNIERTPGDTILW